jgi:uncharacterized protein YvpB
MQNQNGALSMKSRSISQLNANTMVETSQIITLSIILRLQNKNRTNETKEASINVEEVDIKVEVGTKEDTKVDIEEEDAI